MKTVARTSSAAHRIVPDRIVQELRLPARARRLGTLLICLPALFVSGALSAQEPDGWLRTYDGGAGGSLERPVGILTDAEGAIYVSGSTGWGTATVKYDAEGELLWATTTPGRIALGMAIDAAGSLLVGKSPGVIVRYDENGAETLVPRVFGEFRGMVVDESGSVYVSSVSPGSSGFRTTKYDSEFERRWTAVFPGGGRSVGRTVLAVDAEGNPHAAGVINDCRATCATAFAAVKYSSDEGEILWSTYEEPVHASFDVIALTTDTSGHCVALGSVESCGGGGAGLALAKYDLDGTELWTSCYEPALQGSVDGIAVATDASGGIYVSGAGCDTGDCSFVTLKYGPDGNLLWEAELPGGRPTALSLDPNGAIIVAGTESFCEGPGCETAYLTVKYTTDGGEQWIRRFAAPPGEEASASALALDAAGGVYVAGTIARDYGVVKYDPAGGEAWSATHNTPMEREDMPIGVRPAGDASSYVVSNSCDGEGCDTVVLKYDRSGAVVWERRIDDGRATAMAVDDAANLHVSGVGAGPRPGNWIAKYDPDGTRLWLAPASDSYPVEIGVDAEGYVYLAAMRGLAKYDVDGIEVWSAFSADDHLIGMEVDPAGYVYLAERDALSARIALFDQGGNAIWRVPFGTPGADLDEIAVDPNGNLYATGGIREGRGRTPLTVKYDLDGDEIWSARIPGHLNEILSSAMTVGPAGNVYVSVGACVNGLCETITARYHSGGAEAWIKRGGEFVEEPRLEVDATGALYVHGLSSPTVKYSAGGDQLWSLRLLDTTAAWFALGPERMYLAGSVHGDTVLLRHVRDVFFSDVMGDAPPVDVAVVAPELEFPPEEGPVFHSWNIDGEWYFGESAEHTYDRPGAFEVLLASGGRSISLLSRRTIYVPCPGGDVAPWTSAEIGVTGFPGAARLETAGGAEAISICSGGTYIGASEDSFHFVYQEVSGDVLLSSRVTLVGDGPVRAAVMLRESLEPGSRHVSVVFDRASSTRYRVLSRDTPGGSTFEAVTAPRVEGTSIWLRIRREGDAILASRSLDGTEWVDAGRVELELPETMFAGFGASRRVLPPRPVKDPITVRYDHVTLQASPVQRPFRRGDANADGDVNLPDATVILAALFGGDAGVIGCQKTGDIDDSGTLEITDAVYLLAHLFQSGPAPAEPVEACGVDPTPDALSCDVYEACP